MEQFNIEGTANPQPTNPVKSYKLEFTGNGMEYFKIQFVNLILTIVTLGLYSPWAKAQRLQYFYGHLNLEGSRFSFLGTGKEMFKGFIKGILLISALFALAMVALKNGQFTLYLVIYFGSFVVLGPLVIYGSAKYRFSRTAWRGILWKYDNTFNYVLVEFLKGIGLTIITLGLYSIPFQNRIRRIVFDNLKFGDAYSAYSGKGMDFFAVFLLNYILTILTLGLYFPIFIRNIIEFNVKNFSIYKNDQYMEFNFEKSNCPNWWGLFFGNYLLTLFTFGLYAPIAQVKIMKAIVDCIEIEGNLDLNELVQANHKEGEATADDLGDLAGFDIFF